jgi:CheY-like chemotaxis protein
MQLERVAFNFHAMLQEMVTLFSAIVVKKHCLISLDPSNVPEYILSDPVRLRQVLLNLISNACKFTSKGCIDIKVCLSSPIEKPLSPGDKVRVRVSVKDTGIGMTKEISNRLFKPFTQADSSITRLYGGSGMGLSISAKIVELMEGRIGVESEVDKGSTFWFEIPTEVAASSANIVTLLHADVAAVLDQTPKLDVKDDVLVSEQLDVKDDAPARARVLLVDDNLVNQKVIKALLQRLHCEVDLASSGQEAINKFKGQPEGTYQLVLMDIHMPGKDGHQTARELRSFEQTARLPVFIAALTADVASLKETVEAGMNAFLGKPVTLHDLEIVLNETGKFRKGLIITVPC